MKPDSITREQALKAAFMGGTVERACKNLGIVKSTWYKYRGNWGDDFEEALQEAFIEGKIAKSEVFLSLAEASAKELLEARDKALTIFTLKCHGAGNGWVEKNHLDVTSKGESVNRVWTIVDPDDADE